MIKRAVFAAPLFAMMAAAPLAAQDEATDEAVFIEEDGGEEGVDASAAMMAGMAAMFGEMFKVEPLTDEQTARLPIAESIAAKVLPEGTMAEIVTETIDGIMKPFMSMGPSPALAAASKGLGVPRYQLNELSEEQIAELASIVDPAWQERREREEAALPKVLAEVGTLMEPSMRKAMAEVFAVNFEAGELGELDAFFGTQVGAKFARQSYKMAADPRMIGATIEAVPQIMPKIGDMKAVMDNATAGLAEPRFYDDLSAAEKARVTQISGWSEEDILYGGPATEVDEEAVEEEYEEAVED